MGLGRTERAGDLGIAAEYRSVRVRTEALVEPLSPEDCMVQSMPDASPAKWHLAHTAWFFEKLVLSKAGSGYRAFDPAFDYLFNSYYESLGPRHPRPERGLVTRPSLEVVLEYRHHVDAAMGSLFEQSEALAAVAERVHIGLNHEQQHQELLLTDIKHALSCNPTLPAYSASTGAVSVGRSSSRSGGSTETRGASFKDVPEGLWTLGHAGDGFCYDNETPAHRVFLEAFSIADGLVTNGEYAEFVQAGGYRDPLLWLSDGWRVRCEREWNAPLYWIEREGAWFEFTLRGLQPLSLDEPVAHLSLFEADAFARFAGARLPTEFEWEAYARGVESGGAPGESALHPGRRTSSADPQLFGALWQWTSSSYAPYPRFTPAEGALSEYNAKFMSGQNVLRGGSCATAPLHSRVTYRNFFPPDARWQFSGLRLARDGG